MAAGRLYRRVRVLLCGRVPRPGVQGYPGRFVTGFALLIFVFLNIPSSGGAYAPELLPEPFRWLHAFVAGTGTVNLLRHTVYGVGPAIWRGWLLLAVYGAVGVVLALIGKPYYTRRMKRRAEAGKLPTMMMSTQIAALVQAGYVVRTPADDSVVSAATSAEAYEAAGEPPSAATPRHARRSRSVRLS